MREPLDGIGGGRRTNKEDSTNVMIAEAVDAAREAFEDVIFEKHGVEPAYCRLKLVVEVLDATFEEVLGRVTYEDLA